MMKKAVRAVAVVTCVLAVLGTAGVAAAVDAPKWVAALYVEAQKMVGLRWVPVPGATGYKVMRSLSLGKDEQEIAAPATPQYLDSAVEPGITYYYTLKAVAGAEVSPATEAKMVGIPGAKKTGVETPDMDQVNPQVTVEFGKPIYKMGVVWRGKGAAIAYNLYRSLESGKQGEMVSSSQDQRYVDVNIEPGKTYCYTVTALDAAFQETKASAEKCIEVKAYVAPAEDTAAASGAASTRRPLPKLVAIPSKHGETIRLPNNPYDIDRGKDGTLYIGAARLYRADADGSNLEDITPEGVQYVLNIGMGLDDEVLAGVANAPQFLILSGKKATLVDIPTPEKALLSKDGREWPPQPAGPVDVTQSIDGKYWVTDNRNSRVAIFDENRKFLTNAAAGTADEQIPNVTFIAHDSKGHVFAAAGSENSVNIYDKDGKLIGQFGDTGNIAGSFGRIQGIYVDKEDHLWIADSFNGTVQKFDNTGEFLGALSSEDGKAGAGIITPNAIIVNGKNALVSQGIDKSLVQIILVQ